MMRSAMAFLPDSITTFMNFERSTDPNFGSGRISRLGTLRRRGMVTSFQCLIWRQVSRPDSPDGHRVEWDHPLTRRNVQIVPPQIRSETGLGLFAISFASTCLRRPCWASGRSGEAQAFFGRFAPYLERDCLRSLTPCRSSEPRTM